MLFAIGAARAVVEMLGLCLLGQGILYVLAGRGRQGNPIYRGFAIVTAWPLRAVSGVLPATASPGWIGSTAFALLFVLWIALAIFRKML